MAGIKLKVRASSILEVLIAMVVIVTVLTIALMIFGNVQRLSIPAKKVRAMAVLHEALINAEKAPEISKRTFTADDIRVDEEITNYTGSAGLFFVELTAYDANQEEIVQVREVVNDTK